MGDIGGEGGKEVNMKQSILDFWSEFNLKVERLGQLNDLAWGYQSQKYINNEQ